MTTLAVHPSQRFPEDTINRDAPGISVVIPAFNAERTLPACLGSLERQTEAPLEILLVDDGSTDRTGAIAREAGIRVLSLDENAGPAIARNLGASEALGEVVLFLDADVTVPPNLVKRVGTLFSEHADTAAVQTIYAPTCPAADAVSRYQNLYYHEALASIHRDYVATFATWCAAVRKNAFTLAGGFNESIPEPTVEDEELGYSLADRGMRIRLDGDLQVVHLASYTLGQFIRRRFRMARAQAKSGWRSIRERLLKRYMNLRETGTHHNRTVVLSILLTLLAALTLISAPVTLPLGLPSLGIALALLAAALLCHMRFLHKAVRIFGLRILPAFLAMCLIDMAVLGAGILTGSLEYLIGRKY